MAGRGPYFGSHGTMPFTPRVYGPGMPSALYDIVAHSRSAPGVQFDQDATAGVKGLFYAPRLHTGPLSSGAGIGSPKRFSAL